MLCKARCTKNVFCVDRNVDLTVLFIFHGASPRELDVPNTFISMLITLADLHDMSKQIAAPKTVCWLENVQKCRIVSPLALPFGMVYLNQLSNNFGFECGVCALLRLTDAGPDLCGSWPLVMSQKLKDNPSHGPNRLHCCTPARSACNMMSIFIETHIIL